MEIQEFQQDGGETGSSPLGAGSSDVNKNNKVSTICFPCFPAPRELHLWNATSKGRLSTHNRQLKGLGLTTLTLYKRGRFKRGSF